MLRDKGNSDTTDKPGRWQGTEQIHGTKFVRFCATPTSHEYGSTGHGRARGVCVKTGLESRIQKSGCRAGNAIEPRARQRGHPPEKQ